MAKPPPCAHPFPAALRRAWLASLCLLSLLSGCATQSDGPSDYGGNISYPRHRAAYNRPYRVRGHTYYPMASAKGYRERGEASWYGSESGNITSTGTRFDPRGLTAAHKTLPLPTWVRVINLKNRRSVEVLVNDRGPFAQNRLIDLSQAAARALHIHGTAPVEVTALE